VIALRAPSNRLADTRTLMPALLALLPNAGSGTVTFLPPSSFPSIKKCDESADAITCDASDHDAIGIHMSLALALAAVIESLAVAAQPLQH